MDMFFEKGNSDTVTPAIGYSLLGHALTKVTQSIVILPEKNFGYYNKRFQSYLDSGVISLTVYNAIINNQNEARQVYELSSDIDIDKDTLVSLVEKYGISNVVIEGTTAEIVEDIINEGYQVIKKI